jgi:Protein of unknown function (DUF2752)
VLERALAPVTFDITDSRGAAIALLVAGSVLSLLPAHAGLPCPLRTVTGVPCPMCGMTTSVEATLHGDLPHAFAANPAGPFAVLVALVLLVRRPGGALRAPVAAVTLLFASLWLFELHRFGIL